jgi:serine/threonine protein kinase
MVKQKIKKIYGGKYINAGTAGCVFGEPPLKCINEAQRRSSKFVSKLTAKEYINNDLEYFKRIKALDPVSKYFIIPTETCLVDKSAILETDMFDKCNERANYDTLLFMESGGKNLEYLSLKNNEYISFFNSLTDFLNGIALLHANKYSHFDIKITNIVTIKNKDSIFKTRLIDFDLVSANNVINPTNIYAVKSIYCYWPLELKYYIYSLEYPRHDFTTAFIDDTLNRWYKGQTSYRPYLIPGGSYFNFTGPRYARGSPEIDNLSTLDYSTYDLSKVDIFSLGKTLSDIYFNLIGHCIVLNERNIPGWKSVKMAKPLTQEIIDWHNEVIDNISYPLIELIKLMIHINPAYRPTMQVVIDRYNALLPHIQRLFTEENLNRFLTKNLSLNAPYAYESPPPSPQEEPLTRGRTLNRTNKSRSRRTNSSRSRNNRNSLGSLNKKTMRK